MSKVSKISIVLILQVFLLNHVFARTCLAKSNDMAKKCLAVSSLLPIQHIQNDSKIRLKGILTKAWDKFNKEKELYKKERERYSNDPSVRLYRSIMLSIDMANPYALGGYYGLLFLKNLLIDFMKQDIEKFKNQINKLEQEGAEDVENIKDYDMRYVDYNNLAELQSEIWLREKAISAIEWIIPLMTVNRWVSKIVLCYPLILLKSYMPEKYRFFAYFLIELWQDQANIKLQKAVYGDEYVNTMLANEESKRKWLEFNKKRRKKRELQAEKKAELTTNNIAVEEEQRDFPHTFLVSCNKTELSEPYRFVCQDDSIPGEVILSREESNIFLKSYDYIMSYARTYERKEFAQIRRKQANSTDAIVKKGNSICFNNLPLPVCKGSLGDKEVILIAEYYEGLGYKKLKDLLVETAKEGKIFLFTEFGNDREAINKSYSKTTSEPFILGSISWQYDIINQCLSVLPAFFGKDFGIVVERIVLGVFVPYIKILTKHKDTIESFLPKEAKEEFAKIYEIVKSAKPGRKIQLNTISNDRKVYCNMLYAISGTILIKEIKDREKIKKLWSIIEHLNDFTKTKVLYVYDRFLEERQKEIVSHIKQAMVIVSELHNVPKQFIFPVGAEHLESLRNGLKKEGIEIENVDTYELNLPAQSFDGDRGKVLDKLYGTVGLWTRFVSWMSSWFTKEEESNELFLTKKKQIVERNVKEKRNDGSLIFGSCLDNLNIDESLNSFDDCNKIFEEKTNKEKIELMLTFLKTKGQKNYWYELLVKSLGNKRIIFNIKENVPNLANSKILQDRLEIDVDFDVFKSSERVFFVVLHEVLHVIDKLPKENIAKHEMQILKRNYFMEIAMLLDILSDVDFERIVSAFEEEFIEDPHGIDIAGLICKIKEAFEQLPDKIELKKENVLDLVGNINVRVKGSRYKSMNQVFEAYYHYVKRA